MAKSKNLLQLEVITAKGVEFEGQVNAVATQNDKGKLSILPGHANFISLINGQVAWQIGKQKQETDIGQGVIHVTRDQVAVYSQAQDLSQS